MESGNQPLAKEAEDQGGTVHQDWCAYYRFAVVHRRSLLTDEDVRTHLSKALPRFRVNRGVSRENIQKDIEQAMTNGAVRQYLDAGRRMYDNNARLAVFQCTCTPSKAPEPVLQTKNKKNKPKQNAETEPVSSSSGNIMLSEESDLDEPVNLAKLALEPSLSSAKSEVLGSETPPSAVTVKNPFKLGESTKALNESFELSIAGNAEEPQNDAPAIREVVVDRRSMMSELLSAGSPESVDIKNALEAAESDTNENRTMDVDEGCGILEQNKDDSPVAEKENLNPSSPTVFKNGENRTEENHGVLGSLLENDLALSDEEYFGDLLQLLPESSSPEERVDASDDNDDNMEGRHEPSHEMAITGDPNEETVGAESKPPTVPLSADKESNVAVRNLVKIKFEMGSYHDELDYDCDDIFDQ